MSAQNPHVEKNPREEKNRVEKSLEDVLSEACRVLALIDDAGAAFAASSDVDMRMESWWLLGWPTTRRKGSTRPPTRCPAGSS